MADNQLFPKPGTDTTKRSPAKINGLFHALPQEFIDKHRDVLEAWDWARRPHMPLAEVLPIPELANVVLETVSENRQTTVRSMNGRSMMDMRAYADALSAAESG